MAEKGSLEALKDYRKSISDGLNCYICLRVAVIFLCLLCAGGLTYLVSDFGNHLEINLYAKMLMIGFIGLGLLLAGFVIYRMPLHYKRVQTALIRLDALILRTKMENPGEGRVINVDRELQMIVRILES